MNIQLIGINHKTAPIEIREKFFLSETQQELLLSELKSRPEVIEAIVLSTCNRTELYLHLLEGQSDLYSLIYLIFQIKKVDVISDFQQYFYTYCNEEAVEHFFRVSTGLDSLVLGEKQILGQIKDSIEKARKKTMLGKRFNILSNIAVKAGKKAQSETHIGFGGSSVSWAAIAMVEKMLGSLAGKSVLIIGAGKMSDLALQQIHNRGVAKIYLMNRTADNAASLAAKYQGAAVPFCDIKEILVEVDVCVCAAGAPHYVLEKTTVARVLSKRDHRQLILFDISMPRNIDPAVNELDSAALFHIDDLKERVDQNMQKRKQAIGEVEELIVRKKKEFYVKLANLPSDSLFPYSLKSSL